VEDAEEGGAVDELHRHQLATLDLDQIEDAADVGRHDLTSRSHFLPQQFESPFGPEILRAQGLQCHLDSQLQIEGVPDLTHSATPEHVEDLVALSEDLPDRERLHPLRQVEGLTLGACGGIIIHGFVQPRRGGRRLAWGVSPTLSICRRSAALFGWAQGATSDERSADSGKQ
jgi:hypothetical protein